MFHGWEDYYLLVGSAGAALTGLLFVVATLNTNMERSQALVGASLYITPIVLNLAMIVVLSGAAMVPEIGRVAYGIIAGAIAVIGVLWSARAFLGIRRGAAGNAPHWTDSWFYGAAPTFLYLLLGGAAAYLLAVPASGVEAFAALVMALLLLCIRNAWDLVTWLAPRS